MDERQLADLVEEDRSAVGRLEQPALLGDGAGERASLVPEQLALEQRLRERRAVQTEERLVGARRLTVHGFGEHLLADPGLARGRGR